MTRIIASLAIVMHLVLGLTMAKAPVVQDVIPAFVAADICGDPDAPATGSDHCPWCTIVAAAALPTTQTFFGPVVNTSTATGIPLRNAVPVASFDGWSDARAPPSFA